MFRLCFVWVYIFRDSSLNSACISKAGFINVRTRTNKEKSLPVYPKSFYLKGNINGFRRVLLSYSFTAEWFLTTGVIRESVLRTIRIALMVYFVVLFFRRNIS